MGSRSQAKRNKRRVKTAAPAPTVETAPRASRTRIAVALGLLALSALGAWWLLEGGGAVRQTAVAPASSPPAALANSADQCAACHGEIVAAYLATGMGRSFSRPSPQTMPEFPSAAPAFEHRLSGRTYAIAQRNGEYFLSRYQSGPGGARTNSVERKIDYIMGSGNHAKSFLHHAPDGRILQLPLGWYAGDGGHWAMSPGFDNAHHRGFQREITYDCMSCHNGKPVLPQGAGLAGRDPVYTDAIPNGIGCGRCHGDGAEHIATVSSGRGAEAIRAAIFNPARQPLDRQLETCLQCHLESTSRRLPYATRRPGRSAYSYDPRERLADFVLHFDFAPGKGPDDHFEIAHAAYRLFQSACFREADLTCTTCHDPHHARRGPAAAAHYSEVCASCHEPDLARLGGPDHAANSDCRPCHMPSRRTVDVPHVVMTDHRIQRRPPARDLLAPHPESDAPEYTGEVVLAARPAAALDAETKLMVAAAQVAEGANLKAGTAPLTALLANGGPPHLRYYLAEAYWSAGDDAKAIAEYQQVLAADPGHQIAARNYGVALTETGQLAEAEALLADLVKRYPDDARAHSNWADVLLRLGRARESAQAAETALRLDPGLPQAYTNLALARSSLGEGSAAESAARLAIAWQPDFAPAHSALGSILVDAGRQSEAEAALREAIRLDPQLGPAHLNLGTLLASRGDVRAAEGEFRQAVQAAPRSADGYFNLASTLLAQQRPAEAMPILEQGLVLQPDNARARLNFGMTLLQSGRIQDGRQQIERARDAGDAEVRQIAESILAEL